MRARAREVRNGAQRVPTRVRGDPTRAERVTTPARDAPRGMRRERPSALAVGNAAWGLARGYRSVPAAFDLPCRTALPLLGSAWIAWMICSVDWLDWIVDCVAVENA